MSAGTGRRVDASGGPWEDAFGYARAVRVGEQVHVSGCTAVVDGAVAHPGDAGAQARVALDAALAALTRLGGTDADVVRTRMYVTDRADCEAVGLAHGSRLRGVRPAATMVVVAGLLDPAMLVEIELDAVVTTPQEQS